MRPLSRFVCFAIAALVPLSALAFEQTIWNFRGGELPGSWRVSGAAAPQTTAEGLLINVTSPELTMLSSLALPHGTEVVQVSALVNTTQQLTLLWHRTGDPDENLIQLPFVIPAGPGEQIASLNMAGYTQWDPHTDTIGLLFPQGTQMLLLDIRFAHWNVFERIVEGWKSFWTFDAFTPIVINFLWGPLVTFNPVATFELFTTLPPRGLSAMWVFYAALAVMGAALLAHRFWNGGDDRWTAMFRIGKASGHTVLFLGWFAALWIAFDVRMGAEILSYVKQDYDTWHSQPPGKRVLRTYLNFNDIIEQIRPDLAGVDRIGLLRGPSTPIGAMTRYFVLPTQVVEPTGPRDDIGVWLVFNWDKVTVNSKGELTVDGVPWSKPGKIIKDFNSSFLFKTL